MRIVGREEFLTLPEGTVYSFYESLGNISDLHIKQGTRTNDWIYTNLLTSVDCQDSGEFFDIMQAAEKGATFTNEFDVTERDGMFERWQKFVVYDVEDVRRLITALEETISGSGATLDI